MSNLNQEILAELKKGNKEALNGLPPIVAMRYGLALREEQEEQQSPINENSLAEAMLARLKDSGVKERLTKEIEAQREQEQQDKDKATD